jgi:hypothetical protein
MYPNGNLEVSEESIASMTHDMSLLVRVMYSLALKVFFLLERPNLFAICNNTFSKWWEG